MAGLVAGLLVPGADWRCASDLAAAAVLNSGAFSSSSLVSVSFACGSPSWSDVMFIVSKVIATFFWPIPRKPPTPTTAARMLPSLSTSRSLTLPIFSSLFEPSTFMPMMSEASHWPLVWVLTNFSPAGAFGAVADLSCIVEGDVEDGEEVDGDWADEPAGAGVDGDACGVDGLSCVVVDWANAGVTASAATVVKSAICLRIC